MSNYGTRAHKLASNVAEHERTSHEGNRAVNVRVLTCSACDTKSAQERDYMHARGHARGRRRVGTGEKMGTGCIGPQQSCNGQVTTM